MLRFAVSESLMGVTFCGESNQSHSGRCPKDPFRGDTAPKNPQFLLTLSKIAAGFSADRCFNWVRSGLWVDSSENGHCSYNAVLFVGDGVC